ncbi:MAG: hypoxanthine phosphoribosyltransferase [Clostridiales bacterium GWF2_36_10]|nr:MAG: hypoxanthine phosphoribosyltransferase [Clostridiales bacterium GWF2_36_10]HAN21010.1 hypoxanthine phosphoribosyltransferase [Clostridiales bacterium]
MQDVFSNVEKTLLTEAQIKIRIAEMARQITEDYKDKNLLMVGVLKGSVVFMTDLMRALDINCKIDFMAVSSYGKGTKSSGNLNIQMDLRKDVMGYDVLIAEDILDSGCTLSKVKELIMTRKPASLKIAAFLDKPSRRTVDIKIDYTGFEIPDEFVVGYGLDFDEDYRNLPFIGVLKPEAYEST